MVAAIPQTSRVFKDMRRGNPTPLMSAYYGGICKISYPELAEGHYYDVNSLDPHIMNVRKFPIGAPIFTVF